MLGDPQRHSWYATESSYLRETVFSCQVPTQAISIGWRAATTDTELCNLRDEQSAPTRCNQGGLRDHFLSAPRSINKGTNRLT